MRLIDIDERIELLKNHFDIELTEDEEKEMIRFLNDAPTVDAKPVVHGRWIIGDDFTQCSECNEKTEDDLVEFYFCDLKFCPDCGAKMDLPKIYLQEEP